MILKIAAIFITMAIGLLQIALEYKWHDKRTAPHKKIRKVLIGIMILGFSSAALLVYRDDRGAQEQMSRLIELKNTAEKSTQESEIREQRAQADRHLIQDDLDELKSQIQPFLVIAAAKYPNLDEKNALNRLSDDIKSIGKDLERTKSIIHSFSSQLIISMKANWVDGKVPVTPGIFSLGPAPDMSYSVVLGSGEQRLLELHIDGLATITEKDNNAILSYRAKAPPKSWILGHDLRDIEGFIRLRGTHYGIKRSKVNDNRVYIERLTFEIFANGQTIARFEDNIGISITIPEGDSSPVFDFRLNKIIKNMNRRGQN